MSPSPSTAASSPAEAAPRHGCARRSILAGVSGRVIAATILSVATAFLYSLSNVLEMLEAEQIPDEYALRMD